MPTVFKHTTQTEIGTTPEDVLKIPAGVRATVYIINGDSAVAHYVKRLPIPPNTSVKIITNGEKLILPELSGLRIVSDTENSLDSTISYVEIS